MVLAGVLLAFFVIKLRQKASTKNQTMTSTLFERCIAFHEDDQLLALQCVADFVESSQKNNGAISDDVFNWLLILTGSMVFFMQAGFAMLCAGAVRKKNAKNTMLKNLLDACGAAVAFGATGFALGFGGNSSGDSSFVGSKHFFLSGDVDAAVFFFQYTFSATAATVVAGTLAERCRMVAYLLYSMLLTGFVYPVVAHAVWNENGYFSSTNSDALVGTGMLDFSGSGVIHCTGGFVALFATIVLGPRRGRFYDRNGIPRETPGLQKGHSVALQLLGTMILWFGWYGFNPGSALLLGNDMASSIAAHTVLTTTMSAACGALSALFTNAFLVWRKHDEFHLDLVAAMNGLLSGLVAITAGCAFVDPWASVVIGLISGWMYLFGSWALIKLKIDDAVDAIPVHLANGLWGVFAVGLFASPKPVSAVLGNDDHVGIFYTPDDPTLLGAQIVGALFIFAWTLGTMFPFFLVLNYVGWFRVNELEEIVGLDTTYHGKNSLADSCEEASVTDEVERKEAFLQRRRERTKTHSSLNAIIDGSWGELDVSTPGSEDGMALPEQAPQQAKSLLTSNTTSSDTLTGGFPSNSSASRSAPSSFSENDFPSARSPVVRQFAEL